MLNVAGHTCRSLLYLAPGIPIVFLHGLSYTVDVWERLGVLALLKQKKVSYLALDMPYGAKSECQPKTRDVEVNIAVAREAVSSTFGNVVPIIVGSSIGGHMALEYAARYPVKGLLLTSPVRALQETLVKAYAGFKFPIRIIFGSEDRIVSLEEMRTLSDKLPNSKLKIYQSAGHSAYVNRPDLFKQDLMELYAKAEQN